MNDRPARACPDGAAELPYIGLENEDQAMAEATVKGMTVDDFLRWEDGTDTRYELVGGVVYAMAPPMPSHGRLATALAGEIRTALRSRAPCGVYGEAGIVRPDLNDT